MNEETEAALMRAGHQIDQLQRAANMDRDSRAMFVARIERMQLDGEKWITLVGVLALLNDCDMLASR